jgi:predicted RNA-binding Zn-ribbon protein involved in translation (DUF1610 family)
MMRKYWPVLVVLVTVAALCLSCSTKKKVVTGTQYECKECGKVYRDDTREMEVDRRLAEELGVEVVEGYCPMCGDEPMTLDQTQHYKCPVCGGDGGTEVKKVTLERKLSDTVPTELEVAKACPTGKCAKVGRLHEKYNWDWQVCAAIAEQGIDLGFNQDMVREAWGPPKRVEKVGSAEKWHYDAETITFGASGKVVKID